MNWRFKAPTGHARRRIVAAGAAVGVLVVGAGLAVSLATGRPASPKPDAARKGMPAGVERSHPPAPVSSPASSWTPVATATTVPTETPVQQQYDQDFERGFASASNRNEFAKIASLRLPAPAISGGWPQLPPAYTPDGWTREFVAGLLDIDFSHQSRAALAAWLAAEEAPDLMPGIPPEARLGWLVATVLDPQPGSGARSPIPSRTQWQAYAAAGVRWSVSDLHVQLDPRWQSMIAAGWQPVDLYASVEDASGELNVTRGSATTTSSFSLEVQLGSARWHPGYGTVLVGEVG